MISWELLIGRRVIDDTIGDRRQRGDEQAKERGRGGPAGELSDDECGRVRGPYPCEGIACRSRQSDCWVGERRRRRKPVGCGDVRSHGECNQPGSPPRATPYDGKQAERRDELAHEL